RVQRTGWVLRQVNAPESVADHMYRMSVLSLLADTSSGLNKEKCVKMSLVHDVAESIEYEDQSSAEARFVKDIDKFEMVLQAYEYEQLEEKP
ncbi:HDDC2-like protein, partial [Mya arenaria]